VWFQTCWLAKGFSALAHHFHGKEALDVDVEMLNWEAVVHCLLLLTT
jgi:hypothetical protein